MNSEIIRQLLFRPPLPDVRGSKDYHDKRALYEHMDELINRAELDDYFVRLVVEHQKLDPAKVRTPFLNSCITAFRTNIVRFIENHLPVRNLSIQLAESHIYQWFCKTGNFGPIVAPSKSTLDRYGRILPSEMINELGAKLLKLAGEPITDNVDQALGLDQPLDLGNVWFDTYCLKANIHYPVDWVLFIDATRTLMKATILIRDAGLKNRMPESPDDFLREMNKLGISMSQQRRQKDSKRNRKKILRKMKKAIKKMQKHAQKHRDLLEKRWKETKWTWPQAQQIIERIDGILTQLPAAEKQAHDRIIGERQVNSSEKILSFYESEIQIVVRGKLGVEVEFGNQFLISEQVDGLIVFHLLHEELVSDSISLMQGVESIEKRLSIKVEGACADRGFASKANDEKLADRKNYVCPRNIEELQEKMKDPEFAARQKRRSQTEGRISILVHRFLGDLLRVKGFGNRETASNWAVLSHNLWKLATIRIKQAAEREREKQAQAA